MAVNQTRSMNQDLAEGISDGVVKKLTPDRGGLQDSAEIAAVKSALHEIYDSVWSDVAMSQAASRLAYDRFTSTPYRYPVGQDPVCNVCGNTGCNC
jgi:hypothetical protein